MTPRLRILLLLLLLSLSAGGYFWLRWQGWPGAPATPDGQPRAAKSQQLAKLKPDIQKQIRAYFDGITIPPEQNNVNYAIKLDHGEGRPALQSGDDRHANAVYRKVLAISYQQDSLMGVGIALGILGQIAERAGRAEEARKLVGLQYRVAQAQNNPYETGVVEIHLAQLLERNELAMAHTLRLQAKQHLQGTPYQQDYIHLLATLAKDNAAMGRQDMALNFAQQAWEQAQGVRKGAEIAMARAFAASEYADALAEKQQYQEALTVLQQAAAQYPESNRDTPTYYGLLRAIADNYAALKNWPQAQRFYTDAYNHYQHNRLNALGDEARANLDQQQMGLVDGYVESFVATQDYLRALALLETNKARTLQDIGDDAGQQAAYREVTELRREHAKQRMALFDTLKAVDSPERRIDQLLPGKDADWEMLWKYQRQMRERQEAEMQQLFDRHQLRHVAVADSLDGERLLALQRQLPKDVAVVALFADSNGLHTFVMTNERLDYLDSGMDYATYKRELQAMRTALLNPYVDFYKEPASKLGDKLLKPLLAQLPKQVKRLVYSPDGEFANVPLGVLMPDGQFLTSQYALIRVPSLAVLQADALTAEHAGTGVSCVDPAIAGRRLPFQKATGDHLAKLYGQQVRSLDGKQCGSANLEQALAASKAPAFLHVGAHGFFYDSSAMQSGIMLTANDDDSEGELWDAHAIGSLDLRAFNLVTLSSCETGLSDQDRERDLFGLQRALFYAGTRQVLAPLWSVQDEATHRLMSAFFDAYSQGETAPDALLSAQRKLLQDPRYAHPFFWAGFVLTGDKL